VSWSSDKLHLLQWPGKEGHWHSISKSSNMFFPSCCWLQCWWFLMRTTQSSSPNLRPRTPKAPQDSHTVETRTGCWAHNRPNLVEVEAAITCKNGHSRLWDGCGTKP
jgi:hypothetical protein